MKESDIALSRAEEIIINSISDVWCKLSVEYENNPDEDLRIALNELSKWKAIIHTRYRDKRLSEKKAKREKEVAEFIASFKC